MKKNGRSTVDIQLRIGVASDAIPIPNSDHKSPKIVSDQPNTVKVGSYKVQSVKVDPYRAKYYGKLYQLSSYMRDVKGNTKAGLQQQNNKEREQESDDIFSFEL